MLDGQGVFHCNNFHHHPASLDEDLPQNASSSLLTETSSCSPIEASSTKKAKGDRRKRVRSMKFGAKTGHSRAEKPALSSCGASPPPSVEGGFLCTDLGPLGNSVSPNEDGKLTSSSSDACPKIRMERLVPSLDGIVAKRKQCRYFCRDSGCKEDASSEMEREDEIVGNFDGKDSSEDLFVADGDIADVPPMNEIGRHILSLSEDGIAVNGDDAEIQGHIQLENKIFRNSDGFDAVGVQITADGDGSDVQIHRYIPVPSSNAMIAGRSETDPIQIRGQILDHYGDASLHEVTQVSLIYESVADVDDDEIRGLDLQASAHEVSPQQYVAKIGGHISLEDEIAVDGADDAQIAPSSHGNVEKGDSNPVRSESRGYIMPSSAHKMVTDGEGEANLQGHIAAPLADGYDYADDAQILQDDLLPGLDEMTALRCLAYVPLFDLRNLAQVAKRHHKLVKSGELLDLRWMYGNIDRWICIYTSGDYLWTAYNLKSNEWRNLPPPQVDPIFALSDRESLSAGTHLLWLGRECFNFACYKYDLVTNSWEPGPPMVNPRCLFASASNGKFAFVAGGFKAGELQPTILHSAERYDSRAGKWEPLPPMETPRQKCSGVFMDGKFYVIGGKDKDHNPLASGEVYDPVTNSWTTIPDMYVPQKEAVPSFEPSPPLVAVADNQLYLIDSSTNLLKGYDKGTNTWKVLGPVPVRTDFYNGWGLAFKSHGDELIVIGSFQDSPSAREGVAVFSLHPQFNPTAPEWNSDAPSPPWKLVNLRVRGTGSFLYNCAVMSC